MADNTVSVIIPVFNGERYLAEAIHSALDQTRLPIEIIVVDDGSIDGSAPIVHEIIPLATVPIRYEYQSNRGPAAARNRGLAAAQGDLIAFLDADDWWPNSSLNQRVACLLRNPDLSGVIGATQLMLETGDDLTRPLTPWEMPQPTLNLGGTLIRRRAFDQVGLFNEALTYAEDADWLLRAREAGLRFGLQPAVALMARRHSANVTNQREPSGRYLAQALRQSLMRRQRQTAAPDQPIDLPDFVECSS